MPFENLSETLKETAVDIRDCKTVLVAMPTIKAESRVIAAIENVVFSTLDQAYWVLLKSSLRIQQAEQADRDQLGMGD